MFIFSEMAGVFCIAFAIGGWLCAWRWWIQSKRLSEKTHLLRCRIADVTGVLHHQGMITKGVAHELKNPIAAIVCAANSLEFLLSNTLHDREMATLRHIKEHGEYVLKLMGDFIDLTGGTTGQITSVRRCLPLGDTIDSVVGLLEPSAGRKGITLEVQGGDESIWVEVDPKHLKQILFNLMQNSIKFTPSGGKVTVISAIGPDSESVSIDVCDTGIGISEGEIDRVFDPVWHLGRQRFPEEAGSGLGLALTKTLVDCEGGGIFITSEEGKGTTVRVILNRGASEPVMAHADEGDLDIAGSKPLYGQSVLVVEPDDVLRETLIRVIEKLGGAVDGVSRATEAVNAVHNQSYTAVVIDESVGDMSGYELANIVRNEVPGGSSRIFVATSNKSESDGHGGDPRSETIEKPLSPRAFLDALMANDL